MLDSGYIIYFSLQMSFANRVNSLLFHESLGNRDMIQCVFFKLPLLFSLCIFISYLSSVAYLFANYLGMQHLIGCTH